MGITILLVADSSYEMYLIPILNSILQNDIHNNIEGIHIHLINSDTSEEIYLRRFDKKITFSREHTELDDVRLIYKKVKMHITQKRAYCSNIRIKIISNLLNEGVSKILYLDVDSLVRGDLSLLSNLLDDIDLFYRRFKRENNRIMSGCIGVKNTEKAIKFFQEFNEILCKDNYCTWFADQTILESLVNKNGYGMKFYDVGVSYLDWDFHDESKIWTAKGKIRKDDEKFIKETQKYL